MWRALLFIFKVLSGSIVNTKLLNSLYGWSSLCRDVITVILPNIATVIILESFPFSFSLVVNCASIFLLSLARMC